jgi:hypothetical protein
MANDRDQPEWPRVEPEIIPPDRSGRQSDWRRAPWRSGPFTHSHATHRVYITRLGPFGAALLLLAIAAMVAMLMIAVLGAVLFWIPIVAVAVLVGAVFRLLRG